MPSKKSIIFELNNNLRVYSIADSVNQVAYTLELVRELVRDGKVLELAHKFEFLWQDLDESGELKGVEEIYFLIGSHAGFTDTRMVFMWLKSWQMFDSSNQFYLKKIVFDTPIDFLDSQLLIDTLDQAKNEKNDTVINYSKDPRIGVEA